MIIPLEHILMFSTLLFAIGVYGTLVRRNLIGILISIELILNAVNVNLVAFSRTTALSPDTGQIFTFFVIALAAAAAAVGLAIVLALYRTSRTIFTD
ncbi:MAG: NADH-quinone oxidoreductase subunit NuoK [Candidatus Omnitrophota bacterium]|nr:NADH-quinone oxidoreductase subunit NuoK [Candidatus Omnitrophota bacterium]